MTTSAAAHKLKCSHCGNSGSEGEVLVWSYRVREGVFVEKAQCTDLPACWGRWDRANMGEMPFGEPVEHVRGRA